MPNPARNSWKMMRARCYNPRATSFDRYGGSGITVCDRWRHSFANFLADMGERPPGTSIDRIDGSKGYEPGNCRWATRSEQAQNQRLSRPRRERCEAFKAAQLRDIAMAMTQLPTDALTTAEVAKRLKLTPRHVGHLCGLGVFPGAVKLPGRTTPWLIPTSSLASYAAWCETRKGKVGHPPRGPLRRRRR